MNSLIFLLKSYFLISSYCFSQSIFRSLVVRSERTETSELKLLFLKTINESSNTSLKATKSLLTTKFP